MKSSDLLQLLVLLLSPDDYWMSFLADKHAPCVTDSFLRTPHPSPLRLRLHTWLYDFPVVVSPFSSHFPNMSGEIARFRISSWQVQCEFFFFFLLPWSGTFSLKGLCVDNWGWLTQSHRVSPWNCQADISCSNRSLLFMWTKKHHGAVFVSLFHYRNYTENKLWTKFQLC